MSAIRVYIDFKSPAAYLSLRPTLALAQTMAVGIEWRPLSTKQTAIPAEASDEDVSARHRRVRAIARQRTHLHYAALLNVPLRFRDRPGRTDLALATLAGLQDHQDAFVEAAFKAYWVDGLDLNQADVVASLLDNVGARIPDIADVDVVIDACHAQALADGVIDTPGYLIDGQVFIGREHLPWIQEILTEKQVC